MKQLKEKMNTLKSRITKYKVIIFLILYVCGYCFAAHFCVKPITNKEFELYEQVASDFYNQLGKVSLYELPDGVDLKRTDTKIIVSSTEKTKFGEVIAKMKDEKLVLERDSKDEERAWRSVLIGILIAVVVWVAIFC